MRLLSAAELQRMRRFHFARDRTLYLLAHGLKRLALSRLVPAMAPADWQFGVNAFGRPEVGHASLARQLRFNLSHTAGMVACLVTRGIGCGVDAEGVDADVDPIELGPSVLAPAELAIVRAAPDALRRAEFIRFWTLKEAYLKARGIGMAVPLTELAFDVADAQIALAAPPAIDADTARFQFAQWEVDGRHIVAAAVERGRGPDRQFVLHWAGGAHAALPSLPLSR